MTDREQRKLIDLFKNHGTDKVLGWLLPSNIQRETGAEITNTMINDYRKAVEIAEKHKLIMAACQRGKQK